MNIIIITESLPYPTNTGANIRIWNNITTLSTLGTIFLITFDGQHDKEHLQEVNKFCEVYTFRLPYTPRWKVALNIFTPTPLGVWKRYSPFIKETINNICKTHRIDVILVEEIWMAQYVIDIPTYKIIDKLNIEFVRAYRRFYTIKLSWRSPKSFLDYLFYLLIAIRLRRYESDIIKKFNHIIVCSNVDENRLLQIGPYPTISVIPNAIDTSYYTPQELNSDQNIIVYTGTFSYEPNVDAVLYFTKEIFTLVRRITPDIKFYIVGSNPPIEILELADDGIVVTGYVDDIRDYIKMAKIVVAPIRMGSGTRLKILQAMAMGKPVVSSRVGCEGIDVEHGVHLLVANNTAEFVQYITALLNNPTLQVTLGDQARQLVEQEYSWSRNQSKLIKIFQQIQ